MNTIEKKGKWKGIERTAASVAIPVTFPILFLFVLFILVLLSLALHLGLRKMKKRERDLLHEAEEQTKEFKKIKNQLDKIKTDLEAANLDLERLALIDPLTGLGNRRGFDIQMEKEWLREMREKMPLSLVAVKVDSLSTVIGRHGQLKAEECLKEVAWVIQNHVFRPGDYAARIHDGIFFLILPNTDRTGASKVAERMKERIDAIGFNSDVPPEEGHLVARISVASEVPVPESGPEKLVMQIEISLDMHLPEKKIGHPEPAPR